jgi:aspartokinase/homoserine dehydrogenase 1
MKVMKFGGTSVGSAGSIRSVIDIIRSQPDTIIAVFSAMSGTTDRLGEALVMASEGNLSYTSVLKKIEQRHLSEAGELLNEADLASFSRNLSDLIVRLGDILEGIFRIGEVTKRSSDMVLGFGELMSLELIHAALSERLTDVVRADSREILFTRPFNGEERLDYGISAEAVTKKLPRENRVVVMAGFIASSVKGYPSTLGRGGSDYSAAVIAAATGAEILEIWTDVSGIYTASPSIAEDAFPIRQLSYAEAQEICHFGAKVLYPPAIQPVMQKKIPVIIKNTFAPADEGTLISQESSGNGGVVKAVTSIDNICLVSLTGGGMAGVVGIASRLFMALAKRNINAILITQASSEQSICIAIRQEDGENACEAIDGEFESEIEAGRVRHALLEKNFSIVAIVGEGMKHSVGVSGQAFSALGRNGVNIHAIAQGSSELNISVVVNGSDVKKAVNSIHQEFFSAVNKVINIFIAGTGNVGSALVEQMLRRADYFVSEYKTEFRIVGMVNSRKMLVRSDGIRGPGWKPLMMESGRTTDLEVFKEEMFSLNLPNTIFVDNTSSKEVSSLYDSILEKSISIVTANKIAASSSFESFRKLKSTAVARRAHFRLESNVGAGLPVIQTIENMVKTGDRIIQIEAVLSGTLNFIMNCYCNGMTFSESVLEAVNRGYTEPDPLTDLRGEDLSRKILILAREAGFTLEASDVEFINYLPSPLPERYDPAQFRTQMERYDEFFESQRAGLTSENQRIRIIAGYNNGRALISAVRIGAGHPFYYLEGNDNIVSLYSQRYKERPLIIKGAGAGADVTAAGIFADILSIINN